MKAADPKKNIAALLSGSDRRSIGKANSIVDRMCDEPSCVRAVIDSLLDENPVVRMRASDALEKFSKIQPEALSPYIDFLLIEVADIPQQEIRWHMAQLLPRLALNRKQRQLAVKLLESYLSDKSSIVRTWAINGLAELAKDDRALRKKVELLLSKALKTGTPAMKARARKLISSRFQNT